MKKILFLHSGAEMYGADQILLKIVSNIDKKKFRPYIILPNEGPLCDQLKKNNIEYKVIPYPIIRRKYFNLKGIINYFFEYKKSTKELLGFIKEEEIEIVYSNTLAVLEGISLKKKTNIRYISHIHEMLDNPKIVAKILYALQLKYCDKMIVVSEAVKKHICSLVNKNHTKIITIHNGIEDNGKNKVDKNYFAKKYNLPNDAIIIAVVGRINAIKGQNHFVKVIDEVSKKNKKVYGLIVGDAFSGQEWRIEKLLEQIESLNNSNIIYCGYISEIQSLYNEFDILLLPSVQNDSFPTVVLEAMSFGVPCIAYKCGGVEEMIEEGQNGYLIDQGNTKMMASCVEKMISNQEYLKMKNSTRKIFLERYELNSFIKLIEEIIERNN